MSRDTPAVFFGSQHIVLLNQVMFLALKGVLRYICILMVIHLADIFSSTTV